MYCYIFCNSPGILIENNIDYFKVVIPGVTKDDVASNSEIGRQITIYATEALSNPRIYTDVLQRITDEFVRQNVRPGFAPIVDRQVPGSSYFYYRNDDDGTGKYLPVTVARSYNDTGKDDPLEGVRVDNINQLSVKVKERNELALERLFKTT